MRIVLPPLFAAASLAAAPAPLVLDDVTWHATGTGSSPQLTIRQGSDTSSDIGWSTRTATGGTVGEALSGSDGPVAFALAREAGTLRCAGTVQAGEGTGRCRFVSSPAFEQALAARGVAMGRRTQLLAMMLVDARIDRVDGLAREGMAPRRAHELLAASALDVSGGYARALKAAGLSIRSLGDLVACRALKIDAAWVRGFTAAGYRLDASHALALKANGVTAGYARAMQARAAQ